MLGAGQEPSCGHLLVKLSGVMRVSLGELFFR